MSKSTTINLTPEQREQIRKATGQEHDSVKIEAMPTGGALSDRQTPKLKMRHALKGKKALKFRGAPKSHLRG